MKKLNVKSLRAGQTVYYVYDFGIILQHNILSRAYSFTFYSGDKSLFVKSTANPQLFERGFSLRDCNIIPNTYNKHKCFYSKKKAQSYLKLVLSGTALGK